ncbi:MAG: hypothetical protein GQ468_05315 [Candidatus Scalindua sp.]|nr:hypothetical protein [Candidatus Scalindua sp.]
MKITLNHARSVIMPGRKSGYCARGCREFAEKYDLNWNAFCSEGIEEEELLALDNAMANKIVEWAHGIKK